MVNNGFTSEQGESGWNIEGHCHLVYRWALCGSALLALSLPTATSRPFLRMTGGHVPDAS